MMYMVNKLCGQLAVILCNLTLPAPKLTNPTTSEEVKITFDKGIIPFDNTVKRGYLPYDTPSVSFHSYYRKQDIY